LHNIFLKGDLKMLDPRAILQRIEEGQENARNNLVIVDKVNEEDIVIASLKHICIDGAVGLVEGCVSVIETAIHPVDNFIAPVTQLISDIVIVSFDQCAKQVGTNNALIVTQIVFIPITGTTGMLGIVANQPNFDINSSATESAARLKLLTDSISDYGRKFAQASVPKKAGMISRQITSFFGPGKILSVAGNLTKAAKLGMLPNLPASITALGTLKDSFL
jgi:hypothetical protein